MTDVYTERRCRACGGTIDSLLHLGDLVVPDYVKVVNPLGLVRAPLDWGACADCRLVQLRHTIDPELVFRTYYYRSGVNETMRAELRDVVQQALGFHGPVATSEMVVDIGANDGTLLSYYPKGVGTVAFEPARNLREDLLPHADVLIDAFWPEGKALYDKSVAICTSIATFYATDDPHAYIAEVARVLAPDGIWVVQFQDLQQMLEKTAFDNICHEHVFYPCLTDIKRMVNQHGLRVVHAERRAINGGSLRVIVQNEAKAKAWPTTPVLYQQDAEEGCQDWDTLEKFAWRVGEMRKQITGLVGHMRAHGQIIDLYGASTKSSTLLQLCGLDHTVIRQAWERSPEKIGTKTAGTGIPIVAEEDGRANPPHALLAVIWQFRDAILQREAVYLRAGGSIVFPLPACDIVRNGEPQ